MQIRLFRPEDAAALAEIYHAAVHQLGALRYSPEQLAVWSPGARPAADMAARAGDGRTTLVAVADDGVLAGFAELEADGHVDMLYRRPGAAYAGTGALLLNAVVETAARHGMARLHSEASELARGVFERNGFRVVERRDFPLRGVMIHNYAMERRL